MTIVIDDADVKPRNDLRLRSTIQEDEITLTPSPDSFDLERFVVAQAPVYEAVVRELQTSRKRTHWMWFIFPQLRGLGNSATAHFFGIPTLVQAQAFLTDPMLGARLHACTSLVLESNAQSLHALFGSPDDMKFRSSMTLFSIAVGRPDSVFAQALQRFCNGSADEATIRLLKISK